MNVSITVVQGRQTLRTAPPLPGLALYPTLLHRQSRLFRHSRSLVHVLELLRPIDDDACSCRVNLVILSSLLEPRSGCAVQRFPGRQPASTFPIALVSRSYTVSVIAPRQSERRGNAAGLPTRSPMPCAQDRLSCAGAVRGAVRHVQAGTAPPLPEPVPTAKGRPNSSRIQEIRVTPRRPPAWYATECLWGVWSPKLAHSAHLPGKAVNREICAA